MQLMLQVPSPKSSSLIAGTSSLMVYLLPNTFWFLDVFRLLSSRKGFFQETMQLHKLPYNSFFGFFINISEKI